MDALRILKRSLYFVGLILLLFCVVGAVLVYTYQDQLVSRFVAEANRKIDTPIQAGSIEASWWQKFPDVSIVLSDVVIDGSLPGPTDTLGTAKTIYCTFNAWDILKGDWVVDQIHLKDGMIFLVQTELGDNNYTIVKKDTTKQKDVGFKLEKIELQNIAVTYLDLLRNQKYLLQTHEVSASLVSRDKMFDVQLDGNITSDALIIGERQFFKDKNVELEGNIRYLQPQKKWDIVETDITVNGSTFGLNGYYDGSEEIIDLSVKGQDTDVQTILSLIPDDLSQKFRHYRSKGDIYFEGSLAGSANSEKSPEVQVKFGCKNASFFHPGHKKGIKQVYLSGNFSSSEAGDLSKATLSLKNVKGVMESLPFKGNLTISNLRDYHIKGDFEGTMDLKSWQNFLPPGEINEATGTMQMDVAFDGPVHYLKAQNAVDKFKTTGEISIDSLNFSLKKSSLPFRNFGGHFLFNGRDLAISDFKGTIGNSDFILNGFFRNIIAFIFSKNQPIGIEADLQAENLDLDELLTGSSKAPDQTVVGKQAYTYFEINPRLALTFNCKIDHLKFRRFRGSSIEGKLRISDQVAHGQHISFETIGGKIAMSGRVDGRQKDHIRVYTKSSYQGIYIDSLFYVFENFGQNFLEDKHLKGQAYAEIDTYMAFDDHLRFKSPDLVVDAGLIIQNGELNNFEPLQKLSTYIDSQDLRNLRFADLKNNIKIKDREIYLPNMVVESNVTTIAVNGMHTFDQNINYRLKVPIKSSKKDKDEYFGAIEEDGSNTNLFLRITGTTSDYQVVYDKDAVKNKIRQDLKEEKWEFRKAVRNKGEDDYQQEIEEDEFFDFDDADSTALKQ